MMNTPVSLCIQETPQAKCLLNRPPTLLPGFLGPRHPGLCHVCGVSGSSCFLALDKHDLHASYFIIILIYIYRFHLQIISVAAPEDFLCSKELNQLLKRVLLEDEKCESVRHPVVSGSL